MKKQKIAVTCTLTLLLSIGAGFSNALAVTTPSITPSPLQKSETILNIHDYPYKTLIIENKIVYDSKKHAYTITDNIGKIYRISGDAKRLARYNNVYVKVTGAFWTGETFAVNDTLILETIESDKTIYGKIIYDSKKQVYSILDKSGGMCKLAGKESFLKKYVNKNVTLEGKYIDNFEKSAIDNVLNVGTITVSKVIRNNLTYDSKRGAYTITDTDGFTYRLSGNQEFKKYLNKYVQVTGDYLDGIETFAVNDNLIVKDIHLINKPSK